MKSRQKIHAVALSGILAALSVVFLSLGSVFTTLDMSAAFLAGLCIIVCRIETDRKYPVGLYILVSLLGFLLLPNKFGPLTYVLLGGCYPLLKEYLEIPKSRVLQWILKIIVFNILLTATVLLSKYFLIAGDEAFVLGIPLYLVGNAALVLYDIALTMMITQYLRWRKRNQRL